MITEKRRTFKKQCHTDTQVDAPTRDSTAALRALDAESVNVDVGSSGRMNI